ncbi:MAG: hypothetical protein PHW99_11380 [Rhodoferax sp.]|nr:hypothetical protein [Rhodoferax sp.]
MQVGYSRTSAKYSAEQKQLAVQHYLDHDQCMASSHGDEKANPGIYVLNPWPGATPSIRVRRRAQTM